MGSNRTITASVPSVHRALQLDHENRRLRRCDGTCWTPRGTTYMSRGPSTTAPSRSSIVSSPSITRNSSSEFGCECQTNSPWTLATFTSWSFTDATSRGCQCSSKEPRPHRGCRYSCVHAVSGGCGVPMGAGRLVRRLGGSGFFVASGWAAAQDQVWLFGFGLSLRGIVEGSASTKTECVADTFCPRADAVAETEVRRSSGPDRVAEQALELDQPIHMGSAIAASARIVTW